MTKSAISDWSTTAASNLDIGGITLDGAVMTPSQVDNAIREMMAQLKTFYTTTTTFASPGLLFGLTLSNNVSDATNDIDIATGYAASRETLVAEVLMTLASGLTKRLDASWAVGTGNGGLDTGVVASANYHVFLIKRTDTGVVDVLFSLSATAPTMPTNYDRKRRIGSIRRPGSTILAFQQTGDKFLYVTGVTDRSGNGATALIAIALSVPTGIVCRPIVQQIQEQATVGDCVTSFGEAGTSVVHALTDTRAASEIDVGFIQGIYRTNTSGELAISVVVASGTLSANITKTLGWYDDRGRDS